MADQREPSVRQRTRVTKGLGGAERIDGGIGSSKPADPGRFTSKDSIKAVSDQLLAKKDALIQTVAQTPISLPAMSGPSGEIVQRLKNPPSFRGPIGLPQTAIDPPPVKLPEDGPVDRTKGADLPQGESPDGAPVHGIQLLRGLETNQPPAHLAGEVPQTYPIAPKLMPTLADPAIAAGPSKNEVLDAPRLVLPASHSVGAGVSLDSLSASAGHRAAEPGLLARSDSRGVTDSQPVISHPGLSSVSNNRGVDLPRETKGWPTQSRTGYPGNVSGIKASVSGSEVSDGQKTRSAIQADHSTSLVRNPLSADLRNFSMASPALSEGGGSRSAQDEGGIGRGEGASGASASLQGGESVDLSKTNELLQQLVDAVRKQRDSSLPVGGPTVYSNR